MKHYLRYCCALLCCALLFPVFSISVSAEDLTIDKLTITDNVKVINDWTSHTYSYTFYSNDGESFTSEFHVPKGIPSSTDRVSVVHGYLVEQTNGAPIIKEGQVSKITLHNAYIKQFAQSTTLSPPIQNFRQIDRVRALVYFGDGSMKYYDDVTASQPSTNHNTFTFNIDPYADVLKIEFITTSNFVLSSPATENISVYVYPGENSTANANISLEIETKEEKLLSGIIEWLKGIKEGITNLFDNVKTGFTNIVNKATDIFNSIIELPAKLWTLIENGLKKLFVPSDTYITTFKNNMQLLLEDRLGAVYQVGQKITESWDRIQEYDNTDTISIPEVSINLPNNNVWQYGGWDVKIVPDGFSALANAVRMMTTIVFTLAFINGLRKRYDEVMGVEN